MHAYECGCTSVCRCGDLGQVVLGLLVGEPMDVTTHCLVWHCSQLGIGKHIILEDPQDPLQEEAVGNACDPAP